MKKLKTIVLATAMAGATTVSAATLLNDNFDSYADQAAFQTVWTTIGATPSGTLVSTQGVSAPNAVYFGTVAQRNERSFAESGLASADTVIRFSFDFYDSDSAASPYRQYANLQDGTAASSSGQLISLGLNNNLTSSAEGGNFYMARILGYNGGAYFKLNANPVLLRSSGWHNLAVEISASDYKFYVDGSLARTVADPITLRSYDVVRIGSGLTATQPSLFDNVTVELLVIPEPSGIALGLLGGFGLLVTRLRRK